MSLRCCAALCLNILLLCCAARADNWPQWRGPHGTGICDEQDIAVTWSPTQNVVWRRPLPGPAGATPIVWEDRIFVTSAADADLLLMCLDRDGRILWGRRVTTGNKVVREDEGNTASPTPVTDGRHVWCFMGDGELACYDFDGGEAWKFNVQDRYGKLKIAFGMTSTPVLDRGRLYLQLIHGEGNASTREALVVALDAESGDEIWKHERDSDAVKECEHSYASPVLYDDGRRRFLLAHGADYVTAHSLEDGRELWRCGELNPKSNYNPTLRFVASPSFTAGLIVVPSAKNGPVLGLSPDGRGDITGSDEQRLWTRPRNTPDVPSPLIHDGIVYLCGEKGTMLCLDAKTGAEIYQQRVHGHRHRASPIYADGHIYMTARDGRVSVLKAGREFELVAQNELHERLSASPAVSDGVLYLRTYKALYAIRR